MDRDPGEGFDTGLTRDDLDPARPVPLDTPWGSIALYVIGDEVLASQSFCPHLQGPLFQGTIAGETVTCPWHQWCFSLRTGDRIDTAALVVPADRLIVCDVGTSPRGTLVLSRPRRGDRTM